MDFSKLISKYFMKQKMMRTVLLTLVPIYIFAVFQFGWRVLGLLLVNLVVASLSEFWIMRMINGDKAKVSEAALVSAGLYTLTLPPVLPMWMSAVGIAFGIIIGKCVFGGFGQNIFNPALVARCFIYVCFPVQMTVQWINPIGGILGGFARWTGAADAITSVTPMINMEMNGVHTPLWKMFLGNTGGSIGETSAILIILAAAYLIYTKTANWKVMASVFGSGLIMSIILYVTGQSFYSPVFQMLSGGFLFGTVFMATDPVTHPQKDIARIAFGVLVGSITIILRTYSLFTEGMMFAILIGNSFSPLLDRNVKEWERMRKEKAEARKVAVTSDGRTVEVTETSVQPETAVRKETVRPETVRVVETVSEPVSEMKDEAVKGAVRETEVPSYTESRTTETYSTPDSHMDSNVNSTIKSNSDPVAETITTEKTSEPVKKFDLSEIEKRIKEPRPDTVKVEVSEGGTVIIQPESSDSTPDGMA